MNRGVPPTALNARTGEFTPPGVTARARANSAADPGVDAEVTRPLSPSRASTTNSDPYVLCVTLLNPSARRPATRVRRGAGACVGVYETGFPGYFVQPAREGGVFMAPVRRPLKRPVGAHAGPPARMQQWQRAAVLIPLTLVSAAWTAELTLTGGASAADRSLPDGSALPSEPVPVPASVTVPGTIGLGTPGAPGGVISSASTHGIPAAAITAYQRAASIINAADPGCHIGWQLIGAIGRVESDHGRVRGSRLGPDGLSRPGIFGAPVDRGGSGKRAIGPFQFVPSTWAVVGVDADGDGSRNAQDIDDAALGAAVYLCSGDEDLSTTAGQRAAVYRYNGSVAYVDLVLSIMGTYSAGEYSPVPDEAAAPQTFVDHVTAAVVAAAQGSVRAGHGRPVRGGAPGSSSQHGSTAGSPGGHAAAPPVGGTIVGDPEVPASGESTTDESPVTGGTDSGSSTDGSTTDGSTAGGSTTDGGTQSEPDQTPSPPPAGGGDSGGSPGGGSAPVLVSSEQAVQMCTDALSQQYGSAPDAAVQQCAAALEGKTVDEAARAVGGIVAGMGDQVGDVGDDSGGGHGGGPGRDAGGDTRGSGGEGGSDGPGPGGSPNPVE